MKPENGSSRSMYRIVGAYIFPTVLFITLTAQLPQYDPYPPETPPPCFDCFGEDSKEFIQAGRQVFENQQMFLIAIEYSGREIPTGDPIWEPNKSVSIPVITLRNRL